MLEAEINTWVNTILFPFMPVITVFIVSALMMSDLPWNDDDDRLLRLYEWSNEECT